MNAQDICRADANPFTSQRRAKALMVLLYLGTFAGCSWYLQHHSVADEFAGARAEYVIWTAVFASGVGYAAASAAYGLYLHRGILRMLNRYDWFDVARWIALVVLVGAGVQGVLTFSATWRATETENELQSLILPLIIIATISAMPALAGFLALRAAALNDAVWAESNVCQMKLLIRLRMECQRLLVALSILLTLLVIATGLRRRALLAVAIKTPQEGVLLYGLVFAILLALSYLTAASALDYRCEKFLKIHADLPKPDDPNLSAVVSRRKDLASVIGVGGSWNTFATIVVVASPLLTALLGSFTDK